MRKTRTPNHTRTLTLDSYECEDGTVDLELKLFDSKHFDIIDRERGAMQAGDPVHDIRATITINRKMVIQNITADFAAIPFSFCRGGDGQIGNLVGKRLDRGWHQAVRAVIGGTHGCTHLSELLLQAPTLAFQTLWISSREAGRDVGRRDLDHHSPPFFVNGCYTWAVGSPITNRFFPQFRPADEDGDD